MLTQSLASTTRRLGFVPIRIDRDVHCARVETKSVIEFGKLVLVPFYLQEEEVLCDGGSRVSGLSACG